jgi:DNA-binding HxlR family transcriptional regulator
LDTIIKKTPCEDFQNEAFCPMAVLLETLSGKWSLPILYRLLNANRPARFSELQRDIAPITQKELTKYLRQFEALGLVTRTVYAEVPPRVDYAITDYGRTLAEPLEHLMRWAETQGQTLFEAKRRQNTNLSARIQYVQLDTIG